MAKIGIDLVKVGVSAVLGAVAMGAALAVATQAAAIFFAATLTAPVSVVVIGSILVAVAIGVGLDYLDKRYQVTERTAAGARNIAQYLEKSNPRDYEGYSSSITELVAP